MANGIKIGNLDISAFKVGSADTKVYLGDTLLYPTAPPVFEGKYKLTLSDSSTVSAECDGTSAVTSGEVASQYSDSVVSAEIGDCVTSIGYRAFENCRSLTSIRIPSGVTSIGEMAFQECRSLTSIVIPNSVTSIGITAFANCYALASCTIGSGVTSIDHAAFMECKSLTSITVEAPTPPTLGFDVFLDSTCPIYVPSQSVNAYKSASGWSDYALRIQAIPNS